MNTVTLTKRERTQIYKATKHYMQTLPLDSAEQIVESALDALTHPGIYGAGNITDEDAIREMLVDAFGKLYPCLTDKGVDSLYSVCLALIRREARVK